MSYSNILFTKRNTSDGSRQGNYYMSTLRHSYGDSVILASLKTSVNVLVKRTGDVCKPNRVVGVTPMTKMARRHTTTSTSNSLKSTPDRHYRTVLLESVNAGLGCTYLRDLALVLLQIHTFSGPSTISDTYVAKNSFSMTRAMPNQMVRFS